MEKNKLGKSGIIDWLKDKWAHNPMFSTLLALLVMVLIQSVVMTNLAGSFAGMFGKMGMAWLNILRNNTYAGIIALGMCFMMNMRLIANPPDSLVQAIGTKINKDTGKVKMGLDAVCVVISCGVDLMAHGRLTSIGLATLATMLFVGPTLTQFNRIFKSKILALAGLAE